MFDPFATLSGLLTMLFGIVGTTVEAFLLPVSQLIIMPILSVLSLFV